MRIRRYAARLLAASSPQPPPDDAAAAAPWLHAAADDCAFCDLTRGSDPQVAPDGIKHKGHKHIGALETRGELLKTDDLAQRPPAPEAHGRGTDHEHSASEDAVALEVTGEAAARPKSQVASDGIKHKGHITVQEPKGEHRSDERVDLPEQPHTPEELIPAQRCDIDYEHSTSKDAAGLEVTEGAAVSPERTYMTTIVSEEATELAVNGGAFVVDEATDEQEAGGTSPLVNGSAIEFEPEVTGGVSLVSGSIAEPEITMGASRDDKAVAEQEVSDASEAATKPADAVTTSGVRTGAPIDGEGVAEPDIEMGASPVDESTAEMDIMQIDCFVSEAATHPGLEEKDSLANENAMQQEVSEGVSPASEAVNEPTDVVTPLEATTGAPLNDNGVADTDIRMGASSLNEFAAEMHFTGLGPVGIEAATHPGLPERVSLANETATERDVSEGVSPSSEATAEPAYVTTGAPLDDKGAADTDIATVSEVTTGAPLDYKGVADTDIKMGASSVNESAAEMDFTPLDSLVFEAGTPPELPEIVPLANENATVQEVSEGVLLVRETATESADVVTMSGVTTGVPLVNEGIAEPDIEMVASPVTESSAQIDVIRLGSLEIDAATHQGLQERVSLANGSATEREVSEGISLVSEAATEPANVVTSLEVITGAPLDNEDIAEPDIKMGASPVYESSAEMDVMRLGSLVVEAATDQGLPERVSFANKTATEREVSEGVPLVSEAADEPADLVTALEVTTGAPLDNERAAEPETKMGASFVNESTAEMDCGRLGSLVSEVVTKTGVTGTANIDAEVSMEPEATGGPSLLIESTDLEITGEVSISKEAAAEPEVTGKASACSEDGGAALNETQPLDCDVDCATVQIENAGVSVANEMQPSRDDAADEFVSVTSTSTGPVRDKSPAADEVTPHDDTPSVSCVSGIVARSVGKSGRTDIICYARRTGKRKLDMTEMKTEQTEMDDSDICDQSEEKATLERIAPCESAMSTAGSVEIKLADIKKGLADNSASSKCKRRKGRYECDIDYCRMTFKKKAELSVHKKNMCTVKSCGKHFRSHKYLRRHQIIHNEDTPYKCPWEDCNMAFKWTWTLADHFQVHTGEKPYRCKTPGCSKIYKYVSDFIRHKKRCKPQR